MDAGIMMNWMTSETLLHRLAFLIGKLESLRYTSESGRVFRTEWAAKTFAFMANKVCNAGDFNIDLWYANVRKEPVDRRIRPRWSVQSLETEWFFALMEQETKAYHFADVLWSVFKLEEESMSYLAKCDDDRGSSVSAANVGHWAVVAKKQ